MTQLFANLHFSPRSFSFSSTKVSTNVAIAGAVYAVYLATHHLRAYATHRRRLARKERRLAEMPAGTEVEGVLTGPLTQTTRIPYYVAGVPSKEHNIVVLVAGNGLSAEYWRALQRHLAANGVASVAYDRFTTTHNVRDPRELTIASHTDEFAAFMHYLQIEGPILASSPTSFVIVGHSMGCAVVQAYIQRLIKQRQTKLSETSSTPKAKIRAVVLADPTPSHALEADPKAKEAFRKNMSRLSAVLPFVSVLADLALIRPFTDLILVGSALKRSVQRKSATTLTPTFSESSTLLNMFATGFLLRRFNQELRTLPTTIAESAREVEAPSRWVYDHDDDEKRVVRETILVNGKGENPFGWTLEEMAQKDKEIVESWKAKKHLLDRSTPHMELVNSAVLVQAILEVVQ
ncbi:Alpha/Beta hydrolase protein [Fimicolochytrium jonesii]|uniref:Alpha/Beta hydrolase protein n=1 Tax=Fimicolochytrium jonesii TaxID=1396493 RepID=UPI0022FF333C|nr:Alpha/Beta hydrolase protein [Fimicolochytrium jonesii]KAI8817057.1 Alpha/Beta hydrolase protein [Fimicolochytrium jonesii]